MIKGVALRTAKTYQYQNKPPHRLFSLFGSFADKAAGRKDDGEVEMKIRDQKVVKVTFWIENASLKRSEDRVILES